MIKPTWLTLDYLDRVSEEYVDKGYCADVYFREEDNTFWKVYYHPEWGMDEGEEITQVYPEQVMTTVYKEYII